MSLARYDVLHAFAGTPHDHSDGREAMSTPAFFHGKVYGTTTRGGADDSRTFWQWEDSK
ncbi:MAG: hypothetical protein WB615_12475 [Candidatus Tumulicola sp.]